MYTVKSNKKSFHVLDRQPNWYVSKTRASLTYNGVSFSIFFFFGSICFLHFEPYAIRNCSLPLFPLRLSTVPWCKNFIISFFALLRILSFVSFASHNQTVHCLSFSIIRIWYFFYAAGFSCSSIFNSFRRIVLMENIDNKPSFTSRWSNFDNNEISFPITHHTAPYSCCHVLDHGISLCAENLNESESGGWMVKKWNSK